MNPGVGKEYRFARGYHHASHHFWWGQLVVPFDFLHPWTEDTIFDPGEVSAFFISVVKDPVDDSGGAGSVAVDNLNSYNVASRAVPNAFEKVDGNSVAAGAAVEWLETQQLDTGLLKSWQEETPNTAHTYDQALALLVFVDSGKWAAADQIVAGLVEAQESDGSWYKSYDAGNVALPCIHCHKWEGDIAWAVYALGRYIDLGGSAAQAVVARNSAAEWLKTRIDPATGCLFEDHTEGTIDAWWAMQAAGPTFVEQEEGLKECLLTHYWDEEMGRFKGGLDWWQPYLDNQTWGAAFLKAIGEEEKALRALSYAREVLRLPGQGAQLYGFDGQAGPWSVWNEGTGQYAAVGGHGANDLVQELLAQQRADGAMLGSPDEFNGGGVWASRWHGIAPTAWLYNALEEEPFRRSLNQVVYLPAIRK